MQKRLLLSIDEVAELLDVPKPTLYRWRLTGKGPRSVLLPNRRVKYRVRDVEEWLASLAGGDRDEPAPQERRATS
jgi:excisionase family DNA binding protein